MGGVKQYDFSALFGADQLSVDFVAYFSAREHTRRVE